MLGQQQMGALVVQSLGISPVVVDKVGIPYARCSPRVSPSTGQQQVGCLHMIGAVPGYLPPHGPQQVGHLHI